MHKETSDDSISKQHAPLLSPTRRALLEKWKRGNTAGAALLQRIPRRLSDEAIPLSFQQQRLWFLDQLEPGNSFYTGTLPLEMQGKLRIDLLERSLNILIERHEALRTCFPAVNGQPYQQIAPLTALRLPVLDLDGLSENVAQQTIEQSILPAMQASLHLASGPLFLAYVVRRHASSHLLLLVMHHAIVDGLSVNILRQELTTIYKAFLSDTPLPLLALPLQYADYAVWQQAWMKSQEMEEQLRYWRERLQDAPVLLELPTDFPRPAVQTYRGAVLRQEIPPALASDLKSWSKQEGVTLFMTMLAAFQILLARYSGQTDIVVGIPIANRLQPELEALIGFFANTLVLRADLSARPTFRHYLRQVRARALEAYAHQEMPFERLVEVLQPPRSLSHNPIFQVTFSLDELTLSTSSMRDLEVRVLSLANATTTQFDLSLSILDTDQGMRILIQYSTDLFAEPTMARMAQHYLNLLSVILCTPDQPIDTLPLLSTREHGQILAAWNAHAEVVSSTWCIHELLMERARQTPEAVALIDGEHHVTFGALNSRANQLGWHLRALGVGPERLVALCLPRSVEMLVSLLGVLKAGGAYLPLDPAYPTRHLTSLLQDSQAELVLTLHALPTEVDAGRATVFDLASAWPRVVTENSAELASAVVPSNLAYVVYTSGSTGQPKGVLISHSALVSHSITLARRFDLCPEDRVLQFASLSFDVAAEEIFPTWLTGAGLVLHRSQSPLPLDELTALLWQQGLTVLNLPTSYWHHWTTNLAETGQGLPGSLRLLIVGSESASLEQLQNWRAQAGQPIDWRYAYGVTEATITSTLYDLPSTQTPDELAANATIPIGRPLENTQIYVLDAHLQPVPIGVTGNLYLGGVALARGYHRRPELSAERFIPHPFASEAGARLYNTGDCARLRADGMLEFLGRNDTQLKVRGYRIEPAEIEAHLREHPGIQEAIVKTASTSTDEQILVAYTLTREHTSCSEQELRAFLKMRLPSYMLPNRFCMLDKLPLTPGGKIDRAALMLSLQEEPGYRGPRTTLEELLAEIWADLLNCERVSIFANFFVLGGHSLLATRLIAQIRETLLVDLPLQKLFEAPTIAELAQVIAHYQGKQEQYTGTLALLPELIPAPDERYQPFPLTEVLQAYWIGQYAAFELGNISTHAYIEVQKTDLDLERFARAWRQLIERHDLLRTIILPEGQMQILSDVAPYEIEVHDLRGQDQQARAEHLENMRQRMSHQMLPTDRWPQFELQATLLDDGLTMLHFSLGPLTGDGTSWAIIDRELAGLYANPEIALPAFAISYRDYVLAELALKHTAMYQRSRDYWQRRLMTMPPAPDLPLACSPSSLTEPRFVRRSLLLEAASWKLVKSRAARRGLTPSGVVLTAFSEILARWSKSARFTLNMTVFNRLPLHPQVNDLVGDFTSLNLLEIDQRRPETFSERARRVQQQLWEDLDHRYFDGVQVVRELARAQGSTLEARMPVVFTSTLGYQSQQETTTPLFISGNVRYSITQTPQVWIDHQVSEAREALAINWDAVEDLFPSELLDDMFTSYRELLNLLASSESCWDKPRIDLLAARQVEQQRASNQTDAPLTSDLLPTLFLAQCQQRPDALAVIAPRKTLNYNEVYLRANQVARHLRAQGASPNTLVAIIMEKGWEQVVAVLGIQIAGAAYLPIDAELPAERIAYLLQHGEVALALTQSWLEGQILWPREIQYFSLDTLEPGAEEAEPLACIQQPTDLAYVIYTSGSTGLPKGVMINHLGAVNTLLDVNERFSVGPGDRVLALSALNFDLSVYDIFGVLAAGASIVLPEASARQDPAHWAELLVREQVTIWNTVPALLDILVDYLTHLSGSLPLSLRLALLSGDWIPLTLPDQARKLAPNLRVISLGGATEASIWSILYPIEQVEQSWKSIPYGSPMRNQRFSILNERMEPCPTWVPGLLYIGGVGLAQGYWRDEAKTEGSFIRHPETGERLYRTGDLGRYLPSGVIEFLGREDFQVKIQGHRIELGEIEAALLSLNGIQTALVTAHGPQQGNRRLIAYIVPQPRYTFTSGELRAFLQQKLPNYMLPSIFVLLESLPLTPNGKINRNALPDPTDAVSQLARGDAPSDATDAGTTLTITRLVATILQRDQIDPTQNLLDLGANSIDMLRILNQMEKELRFRPPMAEFFSQPSIHHLIAAYQHRQPLSAASPAQEESGSAPFALLQDPLERDAWKRRHLELRRGDEQRPLIPLRMHETDEQLRARYLSRRSQRRFAHYPLPFEHLSALLSCLRRFSVEEEGRHLYPSAGTLYPIQVYLHSKARRVENVEAGIYYYHPVRHQLIALAPQIELDPTIHDALINQPIFEEAAFSLFLIAQLSAIAPLYGSAARDFCLLEAGYMSQLLMETAAKNQLGLCPIGALDFARIERFFALDEHQILVHSLLGGTEYEEGEL